MPSLLMHSFKSIVMFAMMPAVMVLFMTLTPFLQALAVSDGITLAQNAKQQIGITLSYDPSYQSLAYPMGDVDPSTGVCTDVIIRAYRQQNIDLQVLVHQDMTRHFSAYPDIWGLSTTDRNIDHRRVPNLETFFTRHGQSLSKTEVESFLPGDIVTWRLTGTGLAHIGIVSAAKATDGTPLIIHNIGRGTKEENILFRFPIEGHFRFYPSFVNEKKHDD